jgi:hypothetical protein
MTSLREEPEIGKQTNVKDEVAVFVDEAMNLQFP